MKAVLARAYVVLSGMILVVVGIAGFFRHEMFNLTFPPAHNVFHLLSGAIAIVAGLRSSTSGPRLFSLILGCIYTLLAIAGFAGLHDFGPIQLGLNLHYDFIHLGIGLLSLLAGFAIPKPALASHS
jgi:uncharacterized protein DUF4383